MAAYPKLLNHLIDALGKLPGIGPRMAQRIAFHLLKARSEEARGLAQLILEAKEKLMQCKKCGNFSAEDLCAICGNSKRDSAVLCIVEQPQDVNAIERTGEFSGIYHLLFGLLEPLEGIGPDELPIKRIISRIKQEGIKEVIIATNPSIEGETTAHYLADQIKPLEVKVTRIASGVPVGSEIEYADEATLGKALSGRRDL